MTSKRQPFIVTIGALSIFLLLAACQSSAETPSLPAATLTPSKIAATETIAASATISPSPTFEVTTTPSPTHAAPPVTDSPPISTSPEGVDIFVDFEQSLGEAPTTFGVNGWWTDEDADIWVQRYAEIGPQVVRLPLFHFIVEPENDNADPDDINWEGFYFNRPYPVGDNRHITYQQWFSALKAADATAMIFIPYLAPWLSKAEAPSTSTAPYPPTDLDEYHELITALVGYLTNEIGFSPEKIIIEPANEPDLKCGGDAVVSCFWQNWTMSELAGVLQSASEAAQDNDPKIRIAGPATCCRGDVLEQLISQYDATQYLDIITFHSYGQGRFNLNPTLSMAERLGKFDIPVYLDEFGNRSYWSNGEKGALWHAAALGEFWKAGLVPIQFSMAEVPWMHPGYNELGLFRSWQNEWEIKPTYWVYVNFYNHLKAIEIVPLSSPVEIPGIAGKGQEGHLAIWLTNATYEKAEGITLLVENWPAQAARIQVLDNLAGSTPIDEFVLTPNSEDQLTFTYPIPVLNSMLFLLTVADNPK